MTAEAMTAPDWNLIDRLAGDSLPEPLLTCEEVAAWLNTTPRTVRRLVSEAGLPAYWVGQQLRFERADVEGWLRAGIAGREDSERNGSGNGDSDTRSGGATAT